MNENSKRGLIITLDGPSGSGKSTASLQIAKHFGIPCLDTGAMYRTVALTCLNRKLSLENEAEVCLAAESLRFRFSFEGDQAVAEVSENGQRFRRLGKEIRAPEVSLAASKIAKLPKMREILVSQQREIGRKDGGVIEGRDAGTVIFPKAPIKFFMTASVEERAKRRYQELLEKLGPETQSYDAVLKEMIERDRQDEQRSASPLKPAADAILLDTTGMEFSQVVSFIVEKVRTHTAKGIS